MDLLALLKRKNSGVARSLKNMSPEEIVNEVLTYPEILEMILKHFDFTRQKIYRLVNRCWNAEICRIQSRKIFSFAQNEKECLEIYGLATKGRALSLPTLLQELFLQRKLNKAQPEELNGTSLLPITRLIMDVALMNISHERSTFGLQLLDRTYTTLTILKTAFLKVPQLSTEFNPVFPNLEALSLLPNLVSISRTSVVDPLELNFFSMLISSAPKLRRLEIRWILSAPLLLKQCDLRRVQSLSVKHFDVHSNVGEALKGVQIDFLKELSITISPDATNIQESLISRFSYSLERLHVGQRMFEDFPLCPKVEHLRVEEFSIQIEPLVARQFPSLKKLEIGGFDPLIDTVDFSISPMRKVEEVSFNRVNEMYFTPLVVCQGAFPHLFLMFPAATSWTVDYFSLAHFCESAELNTDVVVKKLKLVLNDRIVTAKWGQDKGFAFEPQVFAKLNLLKDMEELDLSCFTNYREDILKSLRVIEFGKFPKLKVLRIMLGELQSISSLENAIRNIERVELITHNPLRWSLENEDTLARMMNLVSFRSFGDSHPTTKWLKPQIKLRDSFV